MEEKNGEAPRNARRENIILSLIAFLVALFLTNNWVAALAVAVYASSQMYVTLGMKRGEELFWVLCNIAFMLGFTYMAFALLRTPQEDEFNRTVITICAILLTAGINFQVGFKRRKA